MGGLLYFFSKLFLEFRRNGFDECNNSSDGSSKPKGEA